MSCTAQKNRQNVGEMTKTISFVHMKRMLAIAISSITYIRSLFPEKAYSDRYLEDMRIRVLVNNSTTKQMIQWIAGMYEAMEKEYLKTVVFAVTADESDHLESVLETYTFKFSYGAQGVDTSIECSKGGDPKKIVVAPTVEDAKKSAQKFIRRLLLLTSNFDPLPECVFMTMRLTYYDDVTPKDYQPPGFEPDELNSMNIQKDCTTYEIGKMLSSYHAVQLVVNSYQDQDSSMENPSQSLRAPGPTNSQLSTTHAMAGSDQPENDENAAMTQTQNTQGLGVRCPCGFNQDDGSMLLCGSCKYWQHAICFCLTEDVGFPGVHICNICGDPKNPDLYPTDVTLMKFDENKLRSICTWRRALQACYETSRITISPLSARLSCTKIIAKEIVKKLEQEGIAKPIKGQRNKKDIDRARLDAIFHRDIRNMGNNMIKQRIESITRLQNNTPMMLLSPTTAAKYDETPIKGNCETNNEDVGGRSTKRKLGVDSQSAAIGQAAKNKSQKKTHSKY